MGLRISQEQGVAVMLSFGLKTSGPRVVYVAVIWDSNI